MQFSRTLRSHHHGTGLGLSVAYGVITQYGGHISLRSTSTSGTTFQILLPVATGAATPSPKATQQRDTPSGTETILIVDDEPTIRDSTTKALTYLGYNVLVASGANEAIEIAENPEFDIQLLLTDVAMPQINGLQLANTLVSKQPNLSVLYMTGYDSRSHSETSPVAPVLDKPFTVRQLAEAVRNQLNSRKTLQ
ncbi:MAG: response regulator [Fuerstiella sp.]